MGKLRKNMRRIAMITIIKIVPPILAFIIAFTIQYGILKIMGIL